jgi:hypothetical protein
MVSARKFVELKTAPLGVEIAELQPVEKRVRSMEESVGGAAQESDVGTEGDEPVRATDSSPVRERGVHP